MGGVCERYLWTCRPVWPLIIILATVPCMLHSSGSPAAVVGKMYPRGNHWAVGHLMGKKSLHEANRDSDYLSPRSKPAGVTVLEHLMEALMQPKNQKQMIPQTADSLLRLHSSWRDEDREKYLGKMKDLLLLALRLQDNNSTAVQDESLFKKSSLST